MTFLYGFGNVPGMARRAGVLAAVTGLIAGLVALAPTPAYAGEQTFTADGTFTVPVGVTSIAVFVGGSRGDPGQGGSAGGYGAMVVVPDLTVASGQELAIVINSSSYSGGEFGPSTPGNYGGGGGAASTVDLAGSSQMIAGGGGGGGGHFGGAGGTGGWFPSYGGGGGGGIGDSEGSGGNGGGDGVPGFGGAGSEPGSWGTASNGGAGGRGAPKLFGDTAGGGGGGGGFGGGGGGGASVATFPGGGGGGAGGSTGPAGATYGTSQNETGYVEIEWSNPQTVWFNSNGGSGSMTAQSANVPTALSANTFTLAGFTFAGWNTQAAGGGTAYVDSASYSFLYAQNLYAQWSALPTPIQSPGLGNDQTPAAGCVKSGGAIPRSGVKTLMSPGCDTNAEQPVGVSVRNVQPQLSARGDVRFYTLVCQTTSQAKRGTFSTPINTGHGSACKKGALKIRTSGHKLKLTVVWKTPATATYVAYKKTRTYKT